MAVDITQDIQVFEITFSLDTAQYADGDVLADTQAITAAMRSNGGTGEIRSITLLDKDDKGGALDVVFLKTSATLGTENSAVAVTDANADEILGVVECAAADYVDLIGSQMVCKTDVGLGVQSASTADDLYVGLVSRSTQTYTASGITAKIGILRY